ncbi:ATP-binding protein [Variovorax sp. LT1P1]|uniref:ATP-binding protein n=1 Tax=Variovorax sp. LT1P1 TaxID=3443730 RepID=UPI003F45FE6D
MRSSVHLRERVIAGGLLLIVAFVGSAAYDGWRLHQQVMAVNERELGNLATALAGEADRNLQSVDVLLRDTASWYENFPWRADPDAVVAALSSRAVGVPQVSVLTIVDAAGMQRFRSRPTGEPLADVSDRPYFLKQRDTDTAGLVINEPIVTRTEREPAVVISRRLSRPDGSFDGVVTAIVTLQALQSAYSAIQFGEGSSLVLAQDDGSVVVQQPADAPRTRFPELSALKGGALIDRAASPVDGRAKLIATVGVGSLPLLLAITRDEDEALRPWYDEMWSASIRTGVVCLLIGLTIVALLRQLRRQAEAARERRRLEARLQQTQRLEALGTLAGGIAHDFNNILGAILGFGELAQQQAEPGSALRRHIDRVLQGGARARLLVRRILDFSRSGVTDRAPVHVQTLMEEIVAMLASTLPAGVDLQAQLDAGDAAVLGDATQLYQVAMNICTNAVQAIEGAGTVSIRLRRVDVRAPRVLMHTELAVGPHVCLEVRDTGVGIPPEALQRIFEPFFTTKKQGEGTGLGLAVVHGIVADLGGAIDVASVPGEGTQVSVWLPVCGECAPATVPDTGEWPAGQGEVVMVVDDEQALVELAEETLAGLGYEPVGFDSAERALQAFEADPDRFDALLSDEMLPGMPGTELARLLRAQRPALPVLLMSGKVNQAMVARAQAAGVHAVLHKPLALRELATRLAEALSGRYS